MPPLRGSAAKSRPRPPPEPEEDIEYGGGESADSEKEEEPIDYLAELENAEHQAPQCDDCYQTFGDFEKDLLPDSQEPICWRTSDKNDEGVRCIATGNQCYKCWDTKRREY